MAFIDKHLTQEIPIEQMVRIAGVSERSLYNLFERYAASSPQHYIRQRKLERVHSLLLDPASPIRNVTEAALDYGFLNPGRFAQAYQQSFGELPSQTFRRNRKALQ
jgi:transcriptional regulator GlxA family with amidase domain